MARCLTGEGDVGNRFPARTPSPLAADILDSLEQRPLGRRAVLAGIAGKFRIAEFGAALGKASGKIGHLDDRPFCLNL